MKSPQIQIILALQQFHINDKIIENSLKNSNNPLVDNNSFHEICSTLSATFPEKFSHLTSDSINRAWEVAHEIMQVSYQNNVTILTKNDSEYPVLLKELPDSPPLLYVKGNVSLLNSRCIAVVGTRTPTEYGERKAEVFSEKLVKEGITIVSGLATGIDTAAHTGALAGGGFTIAVLAHGLQMIYPAGNRELAARILENNGALITEYPWYAKLERWTLKNRDRIQSGISRAVFVVETGITGGTMHTVNYCIKQKRSLIVLQHPKEHLKEENSEGNRELIKKYQDQKFTDITNFIVVDKNEDIPLITQLFERVPLTSTPTKNHQWEIADHQMTTSSPPPNQKELGGFVRASSLPANKHETGSSDPTVDVCDSKDKKIGSKKSPKKGSKKPPKKSSDSQTRFSSE